MLKQSVCLGAISSEVKGLSLWSYQGCCRAQIYHRVAGTQISGKLPFLGRMVFAEIQFSFGINDIDAVDESAIVKTRGIHIGVGIIY